MTQADIGELNVGELLALHRGTLHELLRRKIVRTKNAPQGDYAELLVAAAYDGEFAPPSAKSWDVRTNLGDRLQVKSRTIANIKFPGKLSAIRSFEFEALVVVFLSDLDLCLIEARELPVEIVKKHAQWQEHVNAWNLTPNRTVMTRGKDVTERLRLASQSL